jgi:LPXTG-site transpeptidase (sortase) family protein
MKNISKNSIVTILGIFCMLGLVVWWTGGLRNTGLTGRSLSAAAIAPTLSSLDTYSILAALSMSSANTTTLSGDLGLSPGLEVSKTGIWTHTGGSEFFGVGGPSETAQADALTAFNNLAGQPSDGIWSLNPAPVPGVWTAADSPSFSGPTLTLTGNANSVWVFQISTDFTFSGNVVLAGGAQACHVFWQVARDATIASGSNFVGTLIAQNNITSASGSTINGRLISLGGYIHMDGANSTISGPTCATPATLTLVKTITKDNGGVGNATDWTLSATGPITVSGATGSGTVTNAVVPSGTYTLSESLLPSGYNAGSWVCVGGTQIDATHISLTAGSSATCTLNNNDKIPILTLNKIVVGGTASNTDWTLTATGTGNSPTNLSGTTPVISDATFKADTYTLAESGEPLGYTASAWSCGDTPVVGSSVTIGGGDNVVCTITNTYTPPSGGGGGGRYVPPVPPIIDVTKVPSPLALPGGPGPVTYTYKLRNVGTVPVTNITMVDDTCSPVAFVSGDTNADAKLDVNETWTYDCFKTLSATHTNTVVATGWANGISATDVANATVVVGASVVPPLIHVTKVPNPLLLSTPSGMVTYTNKVTNPGIVALSNVRLTDDKCGPVKYISGDTNGNSKLDTNETWIYTCRTNLTKTTTNTVTAQGDANGLTAKDFAIVTVVVSAVPGLPNTGFPPLVEQGSMGLPARLKIPKLNIDTTIESAGLTSDGLMGVPKGPADVAWFNLGPLPGEAGSSVIAGHSGYKDDKPAVFDSLDKLQKGDKIYVEDGKGMTATFIVRELQNYDKNKNALDVFTSNDTGAHLNLITCDGLWNAVDETHSERLVVFTDKI